MQNLEPRDLIEASALFRNMQPHESEAIIARLQPAHFEKGTHILEQGVWHGSLYIIASGQVSVLLPDEAKEQNTALLEHDSTSTRQGYYPITSLGPGECFGEMSLITGEPPSATILADEDCACWSLSQVDLLALFGSCPTLLQNINSIISQRLVRTNQRVFLTRAAEVLWLTFVDKQGTAARRAQAFYIADALAVRTQQRVLLLELCASEQAIGPHFAIYPEQFRPDLLACVQDHASLQAHRAHTRTNDGEHIPAVAALAVTHEKALSISTSQLAVLSELALRYRYILLVTMPETPEHIIKVLAESNELNIKRVITLLATEALDQFDVVKLSGQKSGPSYEHSVFIMNTPEYPTMGMQELYGRQIGHKVTRLLPADQDLLERCWQKRETPRQIVPEGALTRAIDFVARYIAHQTVGIAFGGGGARGFAHLGVLDGLLTHGVPLDYIAACSSGIITPGMYLIGKSIAESEEIFMEIQRHIVQWRIPRTSIFSNRGVQQMLHRLCGERRFEDLTTPFAMVAVDLSTRSGVVLDHGLLWQAGLASVALPGIFPPVVIGEHILVDAGMHDPVPIRLLRRMGADILLASELGGQEPPALENAAAWMEERQDRVDTRSPHIIDLMLRTYDLAMATIGMHSIREADVVIRPKLYRISLRQFSEGRKFVASGREAVEQALPALQKRLPWL